MPAFPGRVVASLLVGTAFTVGALAATGDDLPARFRTPPPETRPWCFWYWMNHHTSRDGITRDLEALQRFGIGTVIIGNIHLPELPVGKVPVLGDEWLELTTFSIREARRLGLEVGFFNCPGWSQTGGPWVSPAQTMRFLTWSETRVAGGRTFQGNLPAPRADFQDVATLAVPVSAEDGVQLQQLAPRVDAPGALDDLRWLLDGNRATVLRFPPDRSEWTLTLTADRPFIARSLTLHPSQADFTLNAELQAAKPDGSYETVRRFRVDRSNNRPNVGPVPHAPVAISFPPVTAAGWRLVLTDISTRDPNAEFLDTPAPTEPKAGIAELELSAAPRVERMMEKQLAKLHPTPKPLWNDYQWPARADRIEEALVTDPTRVIDLTSSIGPDGRLTWTAPVGDWVLLRIGMSPTGITNHPAAPHATGLEVDKMNRTALRQHFDAYVGRVRDRLLAEDRVAFKYLAVDSYEVGSQNWTDDNTARFVRTFGYDPRPWLPVLSGRVVGSADQSDRFLWDLRRLVADRVSYDYAGGLRAIAREAGMKLWLQNYGHWGFPGEFLQYGGQADMLSGEFWAGKDLGDIECRGAASASHTYGLPVTYGEAFTSADFFDYHPYALKARGDWAFAEGVNHLIIQVSMHQPDESRPGTNAWFGTEFNRHNTWFASGRAWTEYLQRCHLLLQTGQNAADVAVFIGEDTPAMTGPTQPAVPDGHAFDYINAEVIQTRLRVERGRFILPDGTSYSLLVLPDRRTMRPELLAKLRELAAAGGAILGPAPERSPSLAGYPASDARVRELAADVWSGRHPNIYGGNDVVGTLRHLRLGPDVAGIEPKRVRWVHRTTPDREIYFLSNQSSEPLTLSPVFRQTGRAPELWDAATGLISRSARFAPVEGRTRVDLSLGPRGSIFVVFPRGEPAVGIASVLRDGRPDTVTRVERDGDAAVARIAANGSYRLQPTEGGALVLDVRDLPPPRTLDGPWQLHFPAGMDTPSSVSLPRLISWSEHSNQAVRHFSGTATYEHTLTVPPDWLAKGRRVVLELGRVEVIAEVSVNGRPAGTAWLPPYRLDVTSLLQPGANPLSIRTSNLWRNRIIGDLKFPDCFPEGPRPKQFQTKLLTLGKWNRDLESLQPSGLLGPVRVFVEQDYPLSFSRR